MSQGTNFAQLLDVICNWGNLWGGCAQDNWCLLSSFVDQITWGTKSWYGFSKCQVLMLNFCFVNTGWFLKGIDSLISHDNPIPTYACDCAPYISHGGVSEPQCGLFHSDSSWRTTDCTNASICLLYPPAPTDFVGMQGLILICMKMCGNSAVEGHELASWSCCYIDLDHFSHALWQVTFACEVLEAPHLQRAYILGTLHQLW